MRRHVRLGWPRWAGSRGSETGCGGDDDLERERVGAGAAGSPSAPAAVARPGSQPCNRQSAGGVAVASPAHAEVLGTLGGVGLLIGPAGLFWLKRRRDSRIVDSSQDGLDVTFLALLFAAGVTGLVLLALRETAVMRPLLVIHLAMVLVLFLTLPYGKFVHGIYRSAALLRYALEQGRRRQPHGAGER